MEFIKNIRVDLTDKNKMKRIGLLFIYIFLWGETFLNLFRVVASAYQVPRDAYYFKGCFFFLVLILFVYRGKIVNWYSGAVTVIFVSGLSIYLIRNRGGFGETYRDFIVYRTLSMLLVVIIVISMIYGKIWRNISLNFRNKGLSAFVIISFGLLIYPSWESWVAVFFPIICYFVAIHSYEEWQRQLYVIFVSGYLASVWFIFKSLHDAPDTYWDGRYIGNFAYPSAGCYIATIGIFCIIGLFIYTKRNKYMKWLLAILLAVPNLYIVMRSFSVTAIIAMLVALFLLLLSEKKSKAKTISIGLVVTLGIIVGGAITLLVVYLKSLGVDGAVEFRNSISVNNPMWRVADKAIGIIYSSYHQYFSPYSVGNVIDRITSDRLSLWIMGIDRIKFFDLIGYGECAVYLPDGTYMGHPHNSYIAWMLLSGGIRGMLLSISVVVLLCMAFKDAKKDIFGAKFCLLWISFSAVVFLSDYKGWTHILYWGMLILAFPLLFSFREDKHLD